MENTAKQKQEPKQEQGQEPGQGQEQERKNKLSSMVLLCNIRQTLPGVAF